MFALSDLPLLEHSLVQSLNDPAAGALVTFEGRVRQQNQGRAVTRLEYEGAELLAANEFQSIEAEACQRFDITQLHCVHRTGMLEIGEIAVWIGVLAPHRGPAFDACRYLIDELKKRLPIWKKEYYADGDSGWINAP